MKKRMRFLMPFLLITLADNNVYAAMNGQEVGIGRTDTVNINDYSTDNWDRFEFNYGFESGADTKETFGTPTQTDHTVQNPEMDNIRRNKDAAYFPPSYGVFSGEIPTNASSPYYTNEKPSFAANTTNSTQIDGFHGTLSSSAGNMSDSGMLASTSTMQGVYTTMTQDKIEIDEDGKVGTLRIDEVNLKAAVYDGEILCRNRRT